MALDLERLVDQALFARVVELRSFTAAALQSGIAKSAVSRRVTSLEKRLGVQLLRRTTRHLAVTTEGARYYEHCAALLAAAKAADEAVATASHAVRGPIRVSAPVTLSQMFVARALAAFLEKHPEVEVQLVTEDRLVDVVAEGFDLVVRVARLKDGSFVARRLAADRLVIAAAPSYLARRGRPESPEELVHHNCLHYELVPRAVEWRFRTREETLSIPVRGNLTATDGTVLREAAIAGLGLAVVPSFMIARDVAEGRLEVVLSSARRAEIGIFGVVAASRGLPLRTKALLDFLSDWFAHPDWQRR